VGTREQPSFLRAQLVRAQVARRLRREDKETMISEGKLVSGPNG
jgi:hypothetical protein